VTLLHILTLSLIQGLTEFLPVSSSGHLVLLPYLFGWQDQGQVMDVALHVGTLAAVILYFWQDIWVMIANFCTYIARGFRQEDLNDPVRLALSIIVATLPAVGAGLILKKMGLGDIRQVTVIATTSIVFAGVLFAADHFSSQKKSLSYMTLGRGFLIGLGQAIALIPGVSRSGICISVGLSLGFTRLAAARFAFLMSIPAITGAAVLTACDALSADTPLVWGDIGLGIVFSALASLAAVHFMLTFLARYSLNIFVIYRIILGLTIYVLL
jgi:undecaprenyl-diphosphatase